MGRPRPPPGKQLEPTASWEFCALGRARWRNGDVDAAVRRFQTLDMLNRWRSAGICTQRGVDGAGATRQGGSWIVLLPGQRRLRECDAGGGQADAVLNNLDAALLGFQSALQKNANLAAAYQHRGELLVRLGRRADAAKDFDAFPPSTCSIDTLVASVQLAEKFVYGLENALNPLRSLALAKCFYGSCPHTLAA